MGSTASDLQQQVVIHVSHLDCPPEPAKQALSRDAFQAMMAPLANPFAASAIRGPYDLIVVSETMSNNG